MKRIPEAGLWGTAALREAAAGSFQHMMELLHAKLRTLFPTPPEDIWPHVVALFADRVVIAHDGELFEHAITKFTDDAIEIGPGSRVIETFKPVESTQREAQGAFLEAVDGGGGGPSGRRWRIRVIRAGLSANRNLYPDAVLREAVPLFQGARVFVKPDAEHIRGGGRDVRNLIGRLVDPIFIEGASPDLGEIQATFEVLESAGDIAQRLAEAHARGMADIFGFSIDAVGLVRPGKVGGKAVRICTAFREIKSVDLIVEPGADGRLIKLIEAKDTGDMKLRDKMIALIEAKRADLYADLDQDDEEAVLAAYREAVAVETTHAPASEDKPSATGAALGNDVDSRIEARVRLAEARAHARAAIAGAGLPGVTAQRLHADFDAREKFIEADVDAAIKAEREYIANFTESGRVSGLGDFPRVEMGESRDQKVADMLDAFFDPAHKAHAQARSFRECYVQITGDARVTGLARHCDQALLRESIGTAEFANVLGDTLHRQLVREYQAQTEFDIWRKLADVVPVNDFRNQERVRFGGYGDLPVVAQGDPYLALASPTDEKVTYTIAKHGGTEEITIEAIKNDDVGFIRRIPVRLTRAAKRTLGKFVLDFIKLNPVIYDGVALFHANHSNLGTTALDANSVPASRLRMLKQKEKDSNEELSIGPKYLWVPPDLEETGVDLFRRSTNNDKTFVQSLALDVMPVWYWTDANDWALSADTANVPALEIGFLDGQEEPELFVQDNPTAGSMFSHDKLSYKLRHIYGGTVVDFRGLQKNVVA